MTSGKKMGRPRKGDGYKTVSFYVSPEGDAAVDGMAAAFCGGNRSSAADMAARTLDWLLGAYEPPLTEDERRVVLDALNGTRVHGMPPSAWPGLVIGNLLELADDGGVEAAAAVEKVRGMPTHEVAMLGLWALRWWSEWPHQTVDDDRAGAADGGCDVVAP